MNKHVWRVVYIWRTYGSWYSSASNVLHFISYSYNSLIEDSVSFKEICPRFLFIFQIHKIEFYCRDDFRDVDVKIENIGEIRDK